MSSNLLATETSPYLLQHAKNPVHWRAWNAATLQHAQHTQQLMLVSVGYSACHWCHVMEHESFEDAEVAAVMNKYFVSVKVDREERPDVDGIYMDACQLISGRGGWPLNAITLPDGRPVYAGTYFPKQQWLQVLQYFARQWEENKEEMMERATQITQGIRAMDALPDAQSNESWMEANEVFKKFDAVWDYQKGGRAGAPKFPMPVTLRYLLQNQFYSKHNKPLLAAQVTADKMYEGGLYDHVGGGFARYSVDDRWEIPHFEKMLYDNAQLLSFYAECYQVLQKKEYLNVLAETCNFLERELSAPEGGFYAALDADSEGEEGKFYVWSWQELKEVLGEDFAAFSEIYAVSEAGNFEHANHLILQDGAMMDDKKQTFINQCKAKLLQVRSQRVRPGLDDKILTSWNALTVSGLVAAYKATGEERYLKRALRCAHFVLEKMIAAEGIVYRNYKNSKRTISGFLDDYSFTCEAFLDLYEVTFDEQWLSNAQRLAEYVIQHFYNASTGLFFYTSVNDEPLIARKTETSDNVIPSSNSSMFKALYKLALINYNDSYLQMVQKAVRVMQPMVAEHPVFYANWAMLTLWMQQEPYVLAIIGENAIDICSELCKNYIPNIILCGSEKESNVPALQLKFVEGKTLLYACQNKTCSAPAQDIKTLMKSLG
ncbi:MAG: thioredoxin domain-containing protein [Chitinophagales bacterium]|nr:thioredoxin domain-containing protein [Chitinophagales bacterium]